MIVSSSRMVAGSQVTARWEGGTYADLYLTGLKDPVDTINMEGRSFTHRVLSVMLGQHTVDWTPKLISDYRRAAGESPKQDL